MRASAIVVSFVLAFSLTVTQDNARAASASGVKAYPVRPVRLILAGGAGSAPDVIARLLGNKLSEAWGQSVVVDNRPGATGLIAVEMLSNAEPDGYTLGLFTMTNLIAMLMYQKHMLATELGAVTLVGTTPFAIVVNASTPVKNVAEWIAYAKARPGQLRYGSTGMWGSLHMCMENFNAINGIKMTHVPYKTAVPVMSDLIAGEIHVFCPAVPMLPPYLKSGRVRALGVTYTESTKLLSGVPPVSDTVSGFSLYGWYGAHVPRKTPPAIIRKINAELVKALKDPKLARIMLVAGAEAVGSTPEEYTAWLKKDTDHWTRLLKQSGATLGKP
ncbi:MAG TPA: tripartite tricarboxylate transporter substrate binding protein [Nitrospiraceae bacterium]|jgi:tripartite-type tricarboxylate transporter receptor subunit TctC